MSQSIISATPALAKNRLLWLEAFRRLSEEDKAQLNPSQAPSRAVLSDLATLVDEKKKLSLQKRWKFTNAKGEKVILRDVFEKISLYIKKVAEVVDVVVQYDPVHTALPWAGIRLLIVIATNDTQVYGAMIEGVELVGRIIARSAVVESMYLQKPSSVTDQLLEGLEKLYASILQHLAKASRYYAQRAMGRVLGLLNISAEKDISTQIDLIVRHDEEIMPLLRLIEREDQQRAINASTFDNLRIKAVGDQIDNLQLDMSNNMSSLNLGVDQVSALVSRSEDQLQHRLSQILNELQGPLIRLSNYLITCEDQLTKKERLDILHWLSTVPHRKHHSNMIKNIIPGSGKWLMLNDIYRNWWNSSISSTLWLHGIPGCGKSMLVARIVQTFLDERKSLNSSAPVAFFYANRAAAEPKRADPSEIIRSILRQLLGSGSDNPLNRAVIDVYSAHKNEAEDDGSDIDLLTIKECIGLILEITSETSATIIIDALDECNPTTRYQLIEALQKIAQQSANVVKIFISSREDGDIVMRMTEVPNVLISASENSEDIQSFIEVEIDKAIEEKRLLGGVLDDKLRSKIKSSLLQSAHGMFQWVNLVIQNLCDSQRLQLAEDVPAEIARLPSGLTDLYRLALIQIYGKAPRAQRTAINALRWLLRAQLPLSSFDFTTAVTRETDTQLLPQDILTLCNNLVVIDMELNIFRFAHLSVREYLESQADFCIEVSEPAIALQCLHICTKYIQELEHSSPAISEQITYAQYASLYWPVHFSLIKTALPASLFDALQAFLEKNESKWSHFEQWMVKTSKFPDRFVTSNMIDRVKMAFSLSCHPIFLAISFEFEDLVTNIVHNYELSENLVNQFGLSPLALACNIGNLKIAREMVESGAQVNIEDQGQSTRFFESGWMPPNPVTAAVYHGHLAIMRLLLAAGADLNLASPDSRFDCPLTMAIIHGSDELVEELIEAGADVNVSSRAYAPIQTAARDGRTRICRLLMDHKAEPTSQGKEPGGGALEQAAAAGHLDTVKLFIEAGVAVDGNHQSLGGTALSQASLQGHCNVAEYLLQQHADPTIDCDSYGSPFLAAVAGGDVEIVSMFLKYGVNVNHTDNARGNALVIAADKYNTEVLAFLLDHGVDSEAEIHYPGISWSTRYMIAQKGSTAMLKILIQSYDSSTRGQKCTELLEPSICSWQDDERGAKVELLIENGADPDVQSLDRTRPIHFAVIRRALSALRVLLKSGAHIDVVSDVYGSPLQALFFPRVEIPPNRFHEDISRAETDVFELLVSKSIDINLRGGLLGTALQAASHFGSFEQVKHMLDLGAIIVEQDGYFGSPFNAAVTMGHDSIVQYFLQMGADANAVCVPYGSTLQAVACHGRRPASLLLESLPDSEPWSFGFDPQKNKPWSFEFKPRSSPEYRSLIEDRDIESYRGTFELLLRSGVGIHAEGGIYGSAAQAAAYAGQIDMMQRLIDNGADIHVKSGFYGSCLQAACCAESRLWWVRNPNDRIPEQTLGLSEETGAPSENSLDFHIAIVELLLTKGADVNYKGGYFGTALQAAIYSDEPEIVKLLLNAGACITEDGEGFFKGCLSAAISFGQRTVAWYETYNMKTILDMLLDHISNQDLPAMAKSAIGRAHDHGNEEGLRVLKLAIAQHSVHHGLVDELFSAAMPEDGSSAPEGSPYDADGIAQAKRRNESKDILSPPKRDYQTLMRTDIPRI